MKAKILMCLIMLMSLSENLSAQTFTLQGRVSDKDNHPIELASVSVVSQGKLALTNLKGEFSMQLHSADSVVVRFSMVGYRAKTRVLKRPRGRQTLQIQLFDDNTIGEVVVEGKTLNTAQPRNWISRTSSKVRR